MKMQTNQLWYVKQIFLMLTTQLISNCWNKEYCSENLGLPNFSCENSWLSTLTDGLNGPLKPKEKEKQQSFQRSSKHFAQLIGICLKEKKGRFDFLEGEKIDRY